MTNTTNSNSARSSMTRRALIATVSVGMLGGALAVATGGSAGAGPTTSLVTGEIERVFLNAPGDVYAGGTLVVGGQNVIIPRNLLIDLPANRVTLQKLFAEAPDACIAAGETGLAKADTCNTAHAGGIATIAANRTSAGDVIAGDVFIQKGVEAVTGTVSYIDYTEGWFRLNGDPTRPDTGVMVRLDDPTARHTIQSGAGCRTGAFNCSADPRFALDADNYTNAFITGMPWCLPSTKARTFVDALDFNGNGNTTESITTKSGLDGKGDMLCPDTNRNANANLLVADSRRFAPIVVGDSMIVKGNFEDIDGVRFLSAHTSQVKRALQTSNAPGQPDYMFLSEAHIAGPAFQNQRIRALFIGYATQIVPDVLLWSIHRDPTSNSPHEFPLGTTRGCDLAGASCTTAGGGGEAGAGIVPGLWKIRYDNDFIKQPTSAKLSPCIQMRRDPRLGAGFCPDRQMDDEFAILSPIPHEIQARTGRKLADANGTLRTFDVSGHEATNGQYLMPFGIGLGGIDMPDFAEINLDKTSMPYVFEGIPWNLDRRLSPGGCLASPTGTSTPACESTPQPLDPFPFSGLDPRTQAFNTLAPGGGVPQGIFADPSYTTQVLTSAADRILSFVDKTTGKFGGDSTVLKLPTAPPPDQGLTPTAPLNATGPLLTGFTPSGAPPGATVQIGGLGLASTTQVLFNGVASPLFTVLNNGRISATVPSGASAQGLISVVLASPATTLTSGSTFTVTPSNANATVASMTPMHGPAGSIVTIFGSSLSTVTKVTFHGLDGTDLAIGSGGNSLTVTVPTGATSGTVNVTAAGGTFTAGTFTVDAPTVPAISAVLPASGPAGTVVTITGPLLGGATSVTFGAVPAPGITVVNPERITVVVPQGAVTAPISVITPLGTAVSASPFTVTGP